MESLGNAATAWILLWKCFKIDEHPRERSILRLWQMLEHLLSCFKEHSTWCSSMQWKAAFKVGRATAVAIADLPVIEPVEESKWIQKIMKLGWWKCNHRPLSTDMPGAKNRAKEMCQLLCLGLWWTSFCDQCSWYFLTSKSHQLVSP